jgi:hypothetical protein
LTNYFSDGSRALFRSAQKSPVEKSIGAPLFFEKNLRFISKNSGTPKSFSRPIFERSEKEGVNR